MTATQYALVVIHAYGASLYVARHMRHARSLSKQIALVLLGLVWPLAMGLEAIAAVLDEEEE